MAIFKVARRKFEEDNGGVFDHSDCKMADEVVCKYETEEDLYRLIKYCMKPEKASYILPVNLQLFGPEIVAYQFMFIQNYVGKSITTRAHHFILSFCTGRYEKFVDKNDIVIIMEWFAREFLEGHQAILCLHTDKPSHYHVHIVIDPVNYNTFTMFRYNIWQIKKKLADELGWYGIALQGITYYDERGRLRRGNEAGVGLYHSMLGKEYYL